MNINVLEKELNKLGIRSNQYSLYGEKKLDAIILNRNYNLWEVFYFDERGKQNNEKRFKTEEEACQYIYNIFGESKDIQEKFDINT